MFSFLTANWGTIVVGAAVAAAVIVIALKMCKDRKRGKSSCGCGCEHCSSSGLCNKE